MDMEIREGLIEGKIIIMVNILYYLRSKEVNFIETTTMKSKKIQSPQLMLARLNAIGNSSKDEYGKTIILKNLINYLRINFPSTTHRNDIINENNIHPFIESVSNEIETELTSMKQVQNLLQHCDDRVNQTSITETIRIFSTINSIIKVLLNQHIPKTSSRENLQLPQQYFQLKSSENPGRDKIVWSSLK